MNRYLLAGCAAVALAMGAGVANAADFSMKIGGDVFFEGGYVSQDNDANTRNTDFRNRFRVNIIPSAKADNGLEYGARLRIRANSGTTVDADRAYMFFKGAFGTVNLGKLSTVNDDMYISRPIDSMFLGQTTPWDSYTKTGTIPYHDYSMVPDALGSKVYYLSPSFGGLQVGATYTPNSGDGSNNINLAKTAGSLQDVYEFTAIYNGSFSGVSLKGSAGYMGGNYQGAGIKDLHEYQVGAQVGYAGFAVGGMYISKGDSGYTTSGKKANSWNAGVQYTTGPLIVGAGYTYGQDNSNGGSTLDNWSISTSYTVAPGLAVGAEYDNVKVDYGNAKSDYKANVVMLRTILSF